MTPVVWPCPLPGGRTAEEYALTFDRDRESRLLVVPALFDEANKLRRFTAEVMRRLDGAGIDSVLPDLPGTNESLQPLASQSAEDWRDAIAAAARHFDATHAFGVRGGCLFTPADLPRWHYAPVKGANVLRQMLRARVLASREAGREEDRETLMQAALANGIDLAGYRLGADMVSGLQALEPAQDHRVSEVGQDVLGGAGLWLRAEPGENGEQADALAAVLAMGIGS